MEEETEWDPTCQRYICFIDIMGFKHMISTMDHHEVYKMMENVVDIQKQNAAVDWEKKGLFVRTTTFSDSIIIYSKDDSNESLVAMISTVSALTQDLLAAGIPHKGALSFGLLTSDEVKSIYFGKPLIDAYLLQEELYFYGVICDGSAERKIDENGDDIFYMAYDCPFKRGRSKHVAITPMTLMHETDKDIEENDNLIAAVEKMKYMTSGSLRVYVESTIEYLKCIRKKTC